MPTDPDRIVFCVKCEAMIGFSAVRCRSCGAKQPGRESGPAARTPQERASDAKVRKRALADVEYEGARPLPRAAKDASEAPPVTRDQMNTLIGLVAALLIATVVLVFDTLRTKPQPEYQYRIMLLTDGNVRDLEILGDGGWEVMSARRARDDADVFFYEVIVRRRK